MFKKLLLSTFLLFNYSSFAEEQKKLVIAIGQPVGGGHDVATRIIAKHIVKYIPNTYVVVENHPGADSLALLRKIDTTFPKDGTYILNFNTGLIVDSYLENKHFLNFKNYNWIGSSSKNNNVCFISSKIPIKSFEDLINYKEKLYFGAVSERDSPWIYTKILQKFTSNSQIVLGFKNPSEAYLAAQRGEVGGVCGQWGPSTVNLVEKGILTPIISFSNKLVDPPSGIIYFKDLSLNNEQKTIINFFNEISDLYRPYIMSKDVPEDVALKIRAAFNSTMIDEEFLADNKKVSIPIEPTLPDRVPDILDKLSKVDKNKVIDYLK
jgi:tripartite-type tricarboxylate transporter receptor subunit TctC